MSSDESSAAPSATARTVRNARPPRRPTLRRASAIASRHLTSVPARRSTSGSRRRAVPATSSSCVTTITVLPCSTGRRINTSSTSLVETCVEVAGRLVGQHEARLVRQRASDRDALLLATAQRTRPMRQPLVEPDRVEELRARRRRARFAARERTSTPARRSRAPSADRAGRSPGTRTRPSPAGNGRGHPAPVAPGPHRRRRRCPAAAGRARRARTATSSCQNPRNL